MTSPSSCPCWTRPTRPRPAGLRPRHRDRHRTARQRARLWSLGVDRWVVERTFAWLHGFRRLRGRWERRADIHEAFLRLACCLIAHRQLHSLCY
ncbi:transposase [Streptomyces flaveolus]|uniref:transposase n=1 Tax=Streptomyces flaveolus TaxID=67297 RepID=UPI0033D91F56